MERSLGACAILILFGGLLGYAICGYFEGLADASNGSLPDDFCFAQPIISPGAGPEMVAAIGSAKSSIHIMLFEFSYPDLKEALVLAARKGVLVRLLLDPKVSQNLDTASFLKSKGVEVKWSPPIFNHYHAKTAIIDGKKVLTGSINWSRNAMKRNREMGVLLEYLPVAEELERIFSQDWREGLDVK